MRKQLMAASLMVALCAPVLEAPAVAQTSNGDRVYRGSDGRTHYRCKRSSGTTGTIAGGVGGAVVGSALGGGALGTVAGGVGGALLGRHLDKKHDAAQNRKNGC